MESQDKNKKNLLKGLYFSKNSQGLRSAIKNVIIRRNSVYRTWTNCQDMSSKVQVNYEPLLSRLPICVLYWKKISDFVQVSS